MTRKHAKLQKNSIKDVGGVVDTSFKKNAISQFRRAVIMPEIIGSKIQYHMSIPLYIYKKKEKEKRRKSSKFQKYPIKDVGGARGT